MIPLTRSICMHGWTVALLLLAVPAIASTELADPMRPAPGWLAGQPPSEAQTTPERPMQPNIIVHGPSRKAAWLDGRPIKAGHSMGEVRVRRIESHHLVLDNGSTITMLEPARIKKERAGK